CSLRVSNGGNRSPDCALPPGRCRVPPSRGERQLRRNYANVRADRCCGSGESPPSVRYQQPWCANSLHTRWEESKCGSSRLSFWQDQSTSAGHGPERGTAIAWFPTSVKKDSPMIISRVNSVKRAFTIVAAVAHSTCARFTILYILYSAAIYTQAHRSTKILHPSSRSTKSFGG